MKKLILLSAVLLGTAVASQAGVHVNVGFGLPLPPIHFPGRVIVSHPVPVYHAPVCAPPPVYVPPRHCEPPRVVYAPPSRYYSHPSHRYGHSSYGHSGWGNRGGSSHHGGNSGHGSHNSHGGHRR